MTHVISKPKLVHLNFFPNLQERKSHNINSLTIQVQATFYNILHMKIAIKAILPLAWEPPKYRCITMILPAFSFFNSCTAYRLLLCVWDCEWKIWIIENKKATLVVPHSTETETSSLRPNPHHHLRWKLSFRQPPVQPMRKISRMITNPFQWLSVSILRNT